MSLQDELIQLKKQARQALELLFRHVRYSTDLTVDARVLANEFGWGEKEWNDVMDFLENEKWAKRMSWGGLDGSISITRAGIRQAEKTIFQGNPTAVTEPPIPESLTTTGHTKDGDSSLLGEVEMELNDSEVRSLYKSGQQYLRLIEKVPFNGSPSMFLAAAELARRERLFPVSKQNKTRINFFSDSDQAIIYFYDLGFGTLIDRGEMSLAAFGSIEAIHAPNNTALVSIFYDYRFSRWRSLLEGWWVQLRKGIESQGWKFVIDTAVPTSPLIVPDDRPWAATGHPSGGTAVLDMTTGREWTPVPQGQSPYPQPQDTTVPSQLTAQLPLVRTAGKNPTWRLANPISQPTQNTTAPSSGQQPSQSVTSKHALAWIPKRPYAKKRAITIYEIVKEMRDEYESDFNDPPSIRELVDRIKTKTQREISEKHLRRTIDWVEAGCPSE